MHQLIRRWATALLALVALCGLATFAATPIHAQILYGSIVGNVTDAQGAVVPAAMVTVTHKEKIGRAHV